MRALRFHHARELCVEKGPKPGPPGPGEVLLQPVMCGICSTDLHEYTDGPIVTPASPHPLTGAGLPQIMGHEFSAVVAATGPGVTHVRDGDLCTVSRSSPAATATNACAGWATCAAPWPVPA